METIIIQELIAILKKQKTDQDSIISQFTESNKSFRVNADLNNKLKSDINQVNQNIALIKNEISQNTEKLNEYVQLQLNYEENLTNKDKEKSDQQIEQQLVQQAEQKKENRFHRYERVFYLLLIIAIIGISFFKVDKNKSVENKLSDSEIKYLILESHVPNPQAVYVRKMTDEYFNKVGRDSALRFINNNK
jgi:cell division protein FtsL